MLLSQEVCQKARLSRDARFDGRFFIAVKTTGIYCRSICPATPPKEANVEYYPTAHQAAQAGFRPCLRCRPESAPQSAAWLGSQALLNRAIKLINNGALENQSLAEFAEYLGISDRYLRQLFIKYVNVAPKAYALYQQCLMAKQLLHQTRLPINQIALACGFNSVRRFNDCFIKAMQLTPSQIRKSGAAGSDKLLLKLSFRPPYDWQRMHDFLQARLIHGLESINTNSYGRTFKLNGCQGSFVAKHLAEQHAFELRLQCEDLRQLRPVLQNIRRILELDTDTSLIEAHLAEQLPKDFQLKTGLRIPGIWSVFEAGIRAILGQQVSVQAAKHLVTQMVAALGNKAVNGQHYFPSAEAVVQSDLAFLKMPGARKQSLRLLAQHFLNDAEDAQNPDTWRAIKGIGPWTVNYAKMRGLNDPDIFLAGDSGIDKALNQITDETNNKTINPELMSPWRSYLTFQLWSQL
ncbi:Methylphosphotriester-DNA--protein-cysteine S-methyltransferase (EC 2.1.1.n11) / DNA-3-methyladenine glycosylase II [hydrothermal vent metagenome]|uniref:Methylphosphotriester-DNA--protein-cysteine S-methyltransferase / DNA-3-methyladenine glycosylase II n=1 Tax=hydrothermal vent metagenome TaxID=652676 RepID=A0A3B0VPS5_9ZZZZ